MGIADDIIRNRKNESIADLIINNKINIPKNTSKNITNVSAKDKKNIYKANENELFKQSDILKNKYTQNNVKIDKSSLLPTADKKTYLQDSTPVYHNKTYQELTEENKNNKIVNVSKQAEENVQKFKNLKNTEELKEQTKKVEKAYDETANSYYDYLKQKVAEDDIGIIDKTLGMAWEGIKAPLSIGKYSLKNENGEKYIMPTYGDLKQQKILESYNTGIGKIAGSALYELGRQGTSFALNALVPGAGTATYFGSMFTDNWNNAIKEGYDDKNSLVYASLGTALEVATGKILGGTTKAVFGADTSNFSEIIGNGLSKLIKNHPKVVNVLSNAIAEGGEEFLQEFIDQFNKKLTLDKSNKVFTKETFEDALYSASVGALTGGFGGLLDTNNSNVRQNSKVNLPNLTETPKPSLPINNYSQNQNVNSTNNVYQFEKSNNIKIDNLKTSASKYFNNSNQTHNFINTLEKIVSDKDYNVIFDDTIKNNTGNIVNAQIKTLNNGELEIRINPNSERNGEFLIMHEVTHAIETESMKKLVLDYASKHTDFNNALKSLRETYGVDDVTSEVLADISGQLFGNQEFINNLSMEQPSIFKRIYDAIISLANKITGNTHENLFIKDLKNKWENAYRNQNKNTLNNTKYHISKNLSQNIDNILSNINERNPVRLRDYTPDILVKSGIKNLPMYENPSHIRKNILTSKEAQNLGLSVMPRDHYHGLGKNIYIKAIDSLDNPRVIFKRNNSSEYLILTTIKDKNNNNIVVPIEIETTTNVNKLKIDINRVKTVYGYDNENPDLNQYIKYNLNTKRFKKIYEQKKERGTGNSTVASSFNGLNIPQDSKTVNSGTSINNYIQNSQSDTQWQEYIEKNYKSTGTTTNMQDISLKSDEKRNVVLPKSNVKLPRDKVLNPLEISKLTKEDANTTPNLPKVKRNKVNDGNSKFYDNIKDKTNMLNEEQKKHILEDDEVKYYDKVTNKESLEKAFKRLEKNGEIESTRWFNKNVEKCDAIDVAEGWILLKQYADNDKIDDMVEVAKRLRNIGTKAGQTVQAFNIMERMTPAGMVKYAQSELLEAYDKMIKNKSKEWIDKHKSDFDLTPNEVAFIMDTMKDISRMEDGYDKRVKLAEIQKIVTDKLPPEKGAGIKSWMRISMLFNPKTQVRNVVGNAIIAPVNSFSDLFASGMDKLVSKKTGVRTTGNTSLKNYSKGFKKGLYESYNDFKKSINTRNIEGNRFELGEGKSFKERTIVGKTLNRVDNLLNFMLDAGDRGFYEATFTNSINNQMVLNNTTEVTQNMIDIATQEALSRTWQDNNKYSSAVLKIRNLLNFDKKYGLGDILIPFAKTPANLTKAIVDYSPVGLVSTLKSGNNLRKSLTNGQYTPQMQHKFVQDLGKATAGTAIYILGYALAKAGIASGESDDDKDVANFLKNTLGISSYSIKIGNKTFTYDWAQPVAAPLAITTNIVNSKNNKELALTEAIIGSLDSAGSVLLEQSFLQSINDVLNSNDGVISALITEVLELPARAIPTLSKQIADMADGTQRQTFEYNQPLKSAVNYAKSKIPGLSKTLAPSVDTMGREIQKYGGKNDVFNVFLNPANVNTENISKSAKEIYRLYKETGETNIMPRIAPYYLNKKSEKVVLNSNQRAEYQKVSGQIIEKNVQELLNNTDYKKMSDEEKANVISNIVDYSYNIAQNKVLGTEISKTYAKAYTYSKVGDIYNYYIFKSQEFVSDKDEEGNSISGSKRKKVIDYVNSMNLKAIEKALLIKFDGYSIKNYDKQIINYINNSSLKISEKEEVLTQMGYKIKNGRVYW